jgi:hypothetical protein
VISWSALSIQTAWTAPSSKQCITSVRGRRRYLLMWNTLRHMHYCDWRQKEVGVKHINKHM